MDPEFWHERWRQGQIGFHLDQVHPDLEAHQEWLLGGGEHRVLVPLCGKSRDLDWIARRGDLAVGVELSEIAVRALFDEAGRRPEVSDGPRCSFFRDSGLVVIRGDFFRLTVEDVGPVDRVWDRAALVALPPEMRRRYAEHLRNLVRPAARILLNTMVYEGNKPGPPHSVDDVEVARLYRGAAIEVVERRDRSDLISPRWRDQGMTRLFTHLSRIELP